jgi:hypothetical protein
VTLSAEAAAVPVAVDWGAPVGVVRGPHGAPTRCLPESEPQCQGGPWFRGTHAARTCSPRVALAAVSGYPTVRPWNGDAGRPPDGGPRPDRGFATRGFATRGFATRGFATRGFATRAIHSGSVPDPATGAVVTPNYQVSTYEQDGVGGLRTVGERTEVFTLGESPGGVESLIEHPGRMTQASVTGSDRRTRSAGISKADDSAERGGG